MQVNGTRTPAKIGCKTKHIAMECNAARKIHRNRNIATGILTVPSEILTVADEPKSSRWTMHLACTRPMLWKKLSQHSHRRSRCLSNRSNETVRSFPYGTVGAETIVDGMCHTTKNQNAFYAPDTLCILISLLRLRQKQFCIILVDNDGTPPRGKMELLRKSSWYIKLVRVETDEGLHDALLRVKIAN